MTSFARKIQRRHARVQGTWIDRKEAVTRMQRAEQLYATLLQQHLFLLTTAAEVCAQLKGAGLEGDEALALKRLTVLVNDMATPK